MEEPGADGRALPGRGDQRRADRLPERLRGPCDGPGGQQLRDERDLLREDIAARRLRQAPQILDHARVGREAGRAALQAQDAELLERRRRIEPFGQALRLLPQGLAAQRARRRELEEHLPQPLLVHLQRVPPLGVPRLAEERGRVRRRLRGHEEPGHLLVVRRQEVRHRAVQPRGDLVETLLGVARLGRGHPREAFHLLDDGQRVPAVRRVVHQRPGGEAQRLPRHPADPLTALGGEPQILQRQVLGLAQRLGHQTDHGPPVQRRVPVAARGQHVALGQARRPRPGARAAKRAERQHRSRLQQIPLVHRSPSSSSSTTRPAYSSEAIRSPSDQATGPTSPSRSRAPRSPCHSRPPVTDSASG